MNEGLYKWKRKKNDQLELDQHETLLTQGMTTQNFFVAPIRTEQSPLCSTEISPHSIIMSFQRSLEPFVVLPSLSLIGSLDTLFYLFPKCQWVWQANFQSTLWSLFPRVRSYSWIVTASADFAISWFQQMEMYLIPTELSRAFWQELTLVSVVSRWGV